MKNPIIPRSLWQMIADPFYDSFRIRPLAQQCDKLRLAKKEGQTRKQFEMLFRRQAQQHEKCVHGLPVECFHVYRLAQEKDAENRGRHVDYYRNSYMWNRHPIA